MAKGLIDAEVILNRAKPLAHQHAPEIQPFGHLVKLPITLAENVCKESVANLNQLLGGVSIAMARLAADAGDDGTNDLLVSDVVRTNELRVWFIAEHVVDVPLARAV